MIDVRGALPLNGSGTVSARGGNGSLRVDGEVTPVPTSGGGGGRIFLSECTATLNVDASGGQPSTTPHRGQQCQGGGAGTAFYAQCGDAGTSQLVLDNGQRESGSYSTISDSE